jgi:hypothetical protein
MFRQQPQAAPNMLGPIEQYSQIVNQQNQARQFERNFRATQAMGTLFRMSLNRDGTINYGKFFQLAAGSPDAAPLLPEVAQQLVVSKNVEAETALRTLEANQRHFDSVNSTLMGEYQEAVRLAQERGDPTKPEMTSKQIQNATARLANYGTIQKKDILTTMQAFGGPDAVTDASTPEERQALASRVHAAALASAGGREASETAHRTVNLTAQQIFEQANRLVPEYNPETGGYNWRSLAERGLVMPGGALSGGGGPGGFATPPPQTIQGHGGGSPGGGNPMGDILAGPSAGPPAGGNMLGVSPPAQAPAPTPDATAMLAPGGPEGPSGAMPMPANIPSGAFGSPTPLMPTQPSPLGPKVPPLPPSAPPAAPMQIAQAPTQAPVPTPVPAPAVGAGARPPAVGYGAGMARPNRPPMGAQPGPLDTALWEDTVKKNHDINEAATIWQRSTRPLLDEVERITKADPKFKPGPGSTTLLRLAEFGSLLGFPKEVMDSLASGSLSNSQILEKLYTQLSTQLLKQALMPGAGRILQSEFDAFQHNNPHLDTDPEAVRKMIGFMRHQGSIIMATQDAWNKQLLHQRSGKGTTGGLEHIFNFDAWWNKRLEDVYERHTPGS